MEKIDWRGDLLKIGEIPDGSEETTFVEFHLDTLNDFIKKVVEEAREEGYQDCMDEQLDKAREEGYQDCIDDIWEEARALRGWTEHDGSISATDIEAGLQEAYLNIEESRKEVS